VLTCPPPQESTSVAGDLLRRYEEYLRQDRGLAENSVHVYVPFIRDFLASRFASTGCAAPQTFDALAIRDFVLGQTDNRSAEYVRLLADFRGCHPAAINLFLFLGAASAMWTVSLFRFGAYAMNGFPLVAAAVGAVCGLLASVAILNFQHGIRYGKISTSWLIINLSTALPTVLSILIYRERVSVRRGLGLLLAVAALLLLWLERRREEQQAIEGLGENSA